MTKTQFLSVLIALFVWQAPAFAQDDDDCVYAVDIDDEDMSGYKLCNADSGINKVLKSIVSNDNDGSTSSVEFKAKAPVTAVDWLESPQALSERRFELLQGIAKECGSGFEVRSEKYLVGPKGGLDLAFDYRCKK